MSAVKLQASQWGLRGDSTLNLSKAEMVGRKVMCPEGNPHEIFVSQRANTYNGAQLFCLSVSVCHPGPVSAPTSTSNDEFHLKRTVWSTSEDFSSPSERYFSSLRYFGGWASCYTSKTWHGPTTGRLGGHVVDVPFRGPQSFAVQGNAPSPHSAADYLPLV